MSIDPFNSYNYFNLSDDDDNTDNTAGEEELKTKDFSSIDLQRIPSSTFNEVDTKRFNSFDFRQKISSNPPLISEPSRKSFEQVFESSKSVIPSESFHMQNSPPVGNLTSELRRKSVESSKETNEQHLSAIEFASHQNPQPNLNSNIENSNQIEVEKINEKKETLDKLFLDVADKLNGSEFNTFLKVEKQINNFKKGKFKRRFFTHAASSLFSVALCAAVIFVVSIFIGFPPLGIAISLFALFGVAGGLISTYLGERISFNEIIKIQQLQNNIPEDFKDYSYLTIPLLEKIKNMSNIDLKQFKEKYSSCLSSIENDKELLRLMIDNIRNFEIEKLNIQTVGEGLDQIAGYELPEVADLVGGYANIPITEDELKSTFKGCKVSITNYDTENRTLTLRCSSREDFNIIQFANFKGFDKVNIEIKQFLKRKIRKEFHLSSSYKVVSHNELKFFVNSYNWW